MAQSLFCSMSYCLLTCFVCVHTCIHYYLSLNLIQYGSVPLMIAAQKGHTKIVQRLLEAGANVNHQNKVMTVNMHLSYK